MSDGLALLLTAVAISWLVMFSLGYNLGLERQAEKQVAWCR